MAINPFRSELDMNQIFQRSFDEPNDRIRVDAQVNAALSGELSVEIDAADGDNISIANADGSKKASITTVGLKNGLDVFVAGGDISITGTVTVEGSDNGVEHTRITVNDSAPVEISAALAGGRDAVSIRILSNVPVYFGSNTVTGEAGADPGYPKYYREEIILDAKSSVTTKLYAICDSGQSAELALIEI